MKLYKSWTMVLALAGALAAPLYGCSSDDVDTTKPKKDKDAGTDKEGDDDKGGDGGEGGNAGEDGGGEGEGEGEGGQGGEGGAGGGNNPVTDATCAELSGESCVDCCEGLYPEGSAIFNAAFDEFFCGASGACKTECAATLCQGQKQVDQGCYECFNANQAGAQSHLQSVCGQSQDCVDFNNNCLLGCQ